MSLPRLDALLDDLPPDFDRRAFASVYADAASVAAGHGTRDREPAYRLRHGHRVARLGLALLSEPDVVAERPGPHARLVVWLAGLLHDLFKEDLGADPPGVDHAARAREYAASRLPAFFDAAMVEGVAEAVFLHNKRDLPAAPEARVVQDADLMDHFGVQEVWLAAYVSGARAQTLEECLAYLTGERNRAWRRYALEHVHFPSARRALVERLRCADAIIRCLRAEADGRLRP